MLGKSLGETLTVTVDSAHLKQIKDQRHGYLINVCSFFENFNTVSNLDFRNKCVLTKLEIRVMIEKIITGVFWSKGKKLLFLR